MCFEIKSIFAEKCSAVLIFSAARTREPVNNIEWRVWNFKYVSSNAVCNFNIYHQKKTCQLLNSTNWPVDRKSKNYENKKIMKYIMRPTNEVHEDVCWVCIFEKYNTSKFA